MEHRELLSGLIRLHVLHHAVEGEIFGQWIIEELARHGYKLSPGTIYPLLRALEKRGYLRSTAKPTGRSTRRIYRATAKGRRALIVAREKVSELFGELLERR